MSKVGRGIPENAIEVTFQYGRNQNGTFYVWETKGGKWQWQALGNCGEAKSQKAAISQAREWIMNGYDPLSN